MTNFFPVIIFVLLFSCISKEDNTTENDAKIPVIAVVNYPLYYFANTIGGDHISVYFPEIEGDPAYWKPSAEQVINFQDADLIFANGAGYAKWMEKVSLPSSKIVVTSIGFKDQWIEVNEGLAHSHGLEGEHVHKGTAFTTWLNFKLASNQSESIYNALNDLLPDHSDEFSRNFMQLKTSLIDLDKRMREVGLGVEDRQLIASHPVYQYMEKGYGLDIISKHWEPNEMPTDDMWKDLKKIVTDHQGRIMIWEEEPLGDIRSKSEQLDVLISVFDPCANTPEIGDFVDVMNANIKRLEKAIDLQ